MTTTTALTVAERISIFLNTVPVYTEVNLMLDSFDRKPQRLMVRDRPTYLADGGRRCTNLTSGMEWFIDAESMERVGAAGLNGIDFSKVAKDGGLR